VGIEVKVKKPAPGRTKRRVEKASNQAWLSIRVELVEGRGEHFWPRPGRLLAASQAHSFAQLAIAIDSAFARWDISHLHEFQLSDGTRIGRPDPDFDEDGVVDDRRQRLSRIETAQQFIYLFDFGDDWTHLCTVANTRVNPLDVLGLVPERPLPYFGWGNIPDQYGRFWDGEDGVSAVPADPEMTDLPPLQPGWGPRPTG
jgi:hypothetical protein